MHRHDHANSMQTTRARWLL